MKIWPIDICSKLRNRLNSKKDAFNLRKNEFHYRLGSDPLTSEVRVRHLKNGSTVFARYSDRLGNGYATDVYMFRPNRSIETKSYHYIRESNSVESEPIGKTITKNFFKNNSYMPYKTETKSIWQQ